MLKELTLKNLALKNLALKKHLGIVLGLWAISWAVAGATAEAKVQVSVTGRLSTANFYLAIGSRVRINFGPNRANVDGLFLGRVVESDGRSDEYLFLDLGRTRAYLVDRTNTQFSSPVRKPQPLLRPIEQWGETCGAYAMTHFWQQYALAGLRGNENLAAMMASERSRTRFLEQNVSQYYLSEPAEIQEVMQAHGKTFGVKCQTKTFSIGSLAADYVWRHVTLGTPVILEFLLGPDMLTSTYETVDFEKPGPIDSRLWIPRKKGQKSYGGHAIVAAAGFKAKGRRKVLVIDSNWEEPRIWDIDRYLGDRVAMKGTAFTTCGVNR